MSKQIATTAIQFVGQAVMVGQGIYRNVEQLLSISPATKSAFNVVQTGPIEHNPATRGIGSRLQIKVPIDRGADRGAVESGDRYSLPNQAISLAFRPLLFGCLGIADERQNRSRS